MRDNDLQLTAPTPPDEVVTVAELHEVARHLTSTGNHDLAAVIRKAIAERGYNTVALDEMVAAATVLAWHAPDVKVDARETGDNMLRLVGGTDTAGILATVRAFIEERTEYVTALRESGIQDADYWRWSGGAEARRQLAERLGWTVPWAMGEKTGPRVAGDR